MEAILPKLDDGVCNDQHSGQVEPPASSLSSTVAPSDAVAPALLASLNAASSNSLQHGGAVASSERPTRMKSLSLFGLYTVQMREERAWRLLYGGLAGVCVLNAIKIPFLLPKIRAFRGAPFLPTKRKTVDVLFDDVLQHRSSSSSSSSICRRASATGTGTVNDPARQSRRLLDFGSGDGRIVFAAARRGYHAVGYEINPWLHFTALVRRKLCLTAEEQRRCHLRFGNVWKLVERRDPFDVITVYGRPGDNVMQHFSDFVRKMKPQVVVSNEYAVPGLERNLVREVHGLKLYQL
ncbi:unnamed protein product [Amoebophrya sp. A25]|nr:unnamed protein product [Amoebophrya sp. A25]|eukprot:GSA25T00002146001.1